MRINKSVESVYVDDAANNKLSQFPLHSIKGIKNVGITTKEKIPLIRANWIDFLYNSQFMDVCLGLGDGYNTL